MILLKKSRAFRIAAFISAFIILFSGNMICSAAFKGIYRRGDADFSGKIDISDAETVQMLLIDSIKDPDGGIAVRGDVNSDGLDIVDSTYIQRYLAGYSNIFKIGNQVGNGKDEPNPDEDELPEDIL